MTPHEAYAIRLIAPNHVQSTHELRISRPMGIAEEAFLEESPVNFHWFAKAKLPTLLSSPARFF